MNESLKKSLVTTVPWVFQITIFSLSTVVNGSKIPNNFYLLHESSLIYNSRSAYYNTLYSPYYNRYCDRYYLYEPMQLSLQKKGWGVDVGFSF